MAAGGRDFCNRKRLFREFSLFDSGVGLLDAFVDYDDSMTHMHLAATFSETVEREPN